MTPGWTKEMEQTGPPSRRGRTDDLYLLLNEKVNRAEFAQARAEFDKEIGRLNDDISDLHHEIRQIREVDLKALQDALIRNQQAGYRRVIAVQASLLLTILAVVLPIVIKVLFRL